MENVMSSIWTDLMFLHGHIASADLARSLVGEQKPQVETAPLVKRSSQPVEKRECGDARCATKPA
jgi:hypothetical protein